MGLSDGPVIAGAMSRLKLTNERKLQITLKGGE